MGYCISVMKNNDQRLNDLLDAPQLLENRFHNCLLFESSSNELASNIGKEERKGGVR